MRTATLSALLLVVLSAGCYQSPVPISTETMPYDQALVGIWQSAENANDRVSVLQFDNGYYYVEMPWDFGSADTTRLRARAYVTEVAGTEFVNMQDIQGEDRSYTFFKLTRLADNGIVLVPLKDLPKFTSSEQLHAYLRAHLRDNAIYDNEARFTKVSSH